MEEEEEEEEKKKKAEKETKRRKVIAGAGVALGKRRVADEQLELTTVAAVGTEAMIARET